MDFKDDFPILKNRKISYLDISNASDALDKLHYRSLTDKKLNVNVDDLEIKIELNKEDRTLTIEDNGLRNDKTRVRRKFRNNC